MADVFAGLPATDADIAFGAAQGDFPVIAERCDRMAEGTDGAIAAGSMTLTSSVPFATQGVQPGHVLVTTRQASPGKPSPIESADMLAVVSAADGSLALGRYGYAPGQGSPPRGVTPTNGATGVRFFIPSVVGVIAAQYLDIQRRLEVVADLATFDPQDLKILTVWATLRDLYFAASRGQDDTFMKKSQNLDTRITARIKTLSRQDVLAAPSAGSTPTGFAAQEFWCW